MKIRGYLPDPTLTRDANIVVAIRKMEQDKYLDKHLDYQEPVIHVLLKEPHVVDICIEGMTL